MEFKLHYMLCLVGVHSMLICFQGLVYGGNETLFESTGLYQRVSLFSDMFITFYFLPFSYDTQWGFGSQILLSTFI